MGSGSSAGKPYGAQGEKTFASADATAVSSDGDRLRARVAELERQHAEDKRRIMELEVVVIAGRTRGNTEVLHSVGSPADAPESAALDCRPCEPDRSWAKTLPQDESSEGREARRQFLEMLQLRRKYMHEADPTSPADAMSKPRLTMVMVDAVAEVPGLVLPDIPSRKDFKTDLVQLWKVAKAPGNKSVAMARLDRLKAFFRTYTLDNAAAERSDLVELAGDIYSVMKVDNHIHLAAAMTPRQLLKFIKLKLALEPEREVVPGKSLRALVKQALPKTPMAAPRQRCVGAATAAAFSFVGSTGDDEDNQVQNEVDAVVDMINVDSLRTCAGDHFYHRFDNFNDAYSPLGCADLRSVFLKSSNHVNGQYFGELTKKVIDDLGKRHCFAEMRVSIYGKDAGEWDELAEWMRAHNLHTSPATKWNLWLIQIPRVFAVFLKKGVVKNFEELINNIFQALFEVALDPGSHPDLAAVLPSIVGFDCVDDESIADPLCARRSQVYGDDVPTEASIDALRPQLWVTAENPPYSYYCYYLYANLRRFNDTCRAMGRPWHLSFRPHAGEAGEVHHLATAFLLADGINHGINLYHSPVLQYLYYIAQIGISVSPISNNALFLKIGNNPFPYFFQRGLNVALSTDDPLMFHATSEPLLEEYTMARHVFALSSTDLCEIAANSVRQSGFAPSVKVAALGREAMQRSPYRWDPHWCNVPSRRLKYRRVRLSEELAFLRKGAPALTQFEGEGGDPDWIRLFSGSHDVRR